MCISTFQLLWSTNNSTSFTYAKKHSEQWQSQQQERTPELACGSSRITQTTKRVICHLGRQCSSLAWNWTHVLCKPFWQKTELSQLGMQSENCEWSHTKHVSVLFTRACAPTLRHWFSAKFLLLGVLPANGETVAKGFTSITRGHKIIIKSLCCLKTVEPIE